MNARLVVTIPLIGMACSGRTVIVPPSPPVSSSSSANVQSTKLAEPGALSGSSVRPANGTWRFGMGTVWFDSEKVVPFSLRDGRIFGTVGSKPEWIRWSPTLEHMVVGDAEGRLSIYEASTGVPVQTSGVDMESRRMNVQETVWAPNGSAFAVGTGGGRSAVVVSLQTRSAWQLQGCALSDRYPSGASCLHFSPDDSQLLHVGGKSETVFDTISGAQKAQFSASMHFADWAQKGEFIVNFPGPVHPSECCVLGPEGGGGRWNPLERRFRWRASKGRFISTSPDQRFLLRADSAKGHEGWAIVNADSGKELASWRWAGSPCPVWVWRPGDKAGLAFLDEGRIVTWNEDNPTVSVLRNESPESAICATPSVFWAADALISWTEPTKPIVDGIHGFGRCSFDKGGNALLELSGGFQVRDGEGRLLVDHKGADVLETIPSAKGRLAWYPDDHKYKWVCVDDFGSSDQLCLTMAILDGQYAIFGISRSGEYSIDAPPQTIDAFLEAVDVKPPGEVQSSRKRFAPELLNRFFH